MNKNGWEQLNCAYFPSVCRRVLGEYLENKGFKEKKETIIGGIVYAYFDLFLEISYDITHSNPMYSVSSVVGFGEEAYNKVGVFNGVPMWYILPEGHPYRTKVYWTFESEKELEGVLLEVKKDFLSTVVQSILTNREGLERVIKSFHAEFC